MLLYTREKLFSIVATSSQKEFCWPSIVVKRLEANWYDSQTSTFLTCTTRPSFSSCIFTFGWTLFKQVHNHNSRKEISFLLNLFDLLTAGDFNEWNNLYYSLFSKKISTQIFQRQETAAAFHWQLCKQEEIQIPASYRVLTNSSM